MKHWDLTPGETVRLNKAGTVTVARFLFRDTLHVVFEYGTGLHEFNLSDDGALLRGTARVTIEGPDRNTRTRLDV